MNILYHQLNIEYLLYFQDSRISISCYKDSVGLVKNFPLYLGIMKYMGGKLRTELQII